MSYDTLLDIASHRRSVRRFTTAPVSRDDLERIVTVGMEAPSGANLQPWDVVIVDDPDLKNQVSQFLLDGIGEKKTAKGFVNAGAFILLYGDDRTRRLTPPALQGNDAWWHFTLNTSLANAFMCMQLAAASLGLGTQWVSAFRNPAVDGPTRELLNIPAEFKIYEMMAVGHPDIKIAPKKLRDIGNVVHYNRAENYRSVEELDREHRRG